jgi:hypothetical protein
MISDVVTGAIVTGFFVILVALIIGDLRGD